MHAAVRRPLAALVVPVLGAGLLGACSSTDGIGDTSSSSKPSSGAASSSPASPSSTTTSTAPSGSSSAGGNAGLESALLPAAAVGAQFTRTVSDTGDRDPLPCTPDKPSLQVQVPPQRYLGATYRHPDQDVQVSENVVVFADDAAAQRYYRAADAGLGCDSGRISGETYRITGPGRLQVSTVDIDAGQGWDLVGKSYKATLAIVRLGARIVSFTFLATTSTTKKVAVQQIIDRAVELADREL
ncbi:hypothetical protein SAMN05443575_0518 [Jatrophihabitans endophyticus]|uniref:PknH-like extracellular domain-containing protein n=1 Tax=Jatrophihabitans endophyticus TaxID=1206085 RepID=A0A1M5DB82_9ACTN|nr:hypothetical protein [Jatrophihabitans endophyticus]SHF64196.1 hypothetical protein SAMN05443575_0518 [Jatrophihabitans endophyticus]